MHPFTITNDITDALTRIERARGFLEAARLSEKWTARLLSTLCLYRTGYDFKRLFTISEYYDRNRPAYYQALQGTRERNFDLTGWLEYFTAGLGAQLRSTGPRGRIDPSGRARVALRAF